MIEDPALELITGTEVTIPVRDRVIFEDVTMKKGEVSLECRTTDSNWVVEFLISLEALDTRILHSVCSTRQKNNSIIGFSIASFEPL